MAQIPIKKIGGGGGGGGGGLSSLLQSAGVTSSDLKSTSTTTWNENEDRFGMSHVTMEDYYLNLREWDFITDWNESVAGAGAGSGVGGKGGGQKGKQKRNKKRSREEEESKSSMAQETSFKFSPSPVKKLLPIPNTFKSREEYQKRWTPLCLSESRAQLISDASGEVPYWNKSPNNGGGGGGGKRGDRSNSNCGGPIAVLATARAKDVGKDKNNMTLIVQPAGVEFPKSNSPSFMQNDVVVLARSKKVFQMASQGRLKHNCGKADCLVSIPMSDMMGSDGGEGGRAASPLWCMVGHVEYGRRSLENLQVVVSRHRWVRTCSSTAISSGAGATTKGNRSDGKEPTTNGKGEPLVLLKIGGNVTAMREFSALCRAGSTPLLQDILGRNLSLSLRENGNEEGKKCPPKMCKSTSSGSLSSEDSTIKWYVQNS